MKPTTVILLLVFAVFCNSCAKETRSGKEYGTIADKSAIFRVTVSLKIPEDDSMSLYYTTDGTTNFYTNKAIWRDVKGSDSIREIVFSLPQKVKPTELRIDFGKNEHQQEIALKEIKMSYKGKSVELPGTLIFSYFRPDFTKTKANPTKATIHGILKDGKAQSPSLYPKDGALSDEIEKLLE